MSKIDWEALMRADDEGTGLDLVASIFAGDGHMAFEVYDRNGECWSEGTAPTIEQVWDMAMEYIRAEWPRSMFK